MSLDDWNFQNKFNIQYEIISSCQMNITKLLALWCLIQNEKTYLNLFGKNSQEMTLFLKLIWLDFWSVSFEVNREGSKTNPV